MYSSVNSFMPFIIPLLLINKFEKKGIISELDETVNENIFICYIVSYTLCISFRHLTDKFNYTLFSFCFSQKLFPIIEKILSLTVME